MANCIIRLVDVFKPLINLLRGPQWSGAHLQVDGTQRQGVVEGGRVAISSLTLGKRVLLAAALSSSLKVE